MGAGEIITIVSIAITIVISLIATIFYQLNKKIDEISTRHESLDKKIDTLIEKTNTSIEKTNTSCETCKANFNKEFREMSERISTTQMCLQKDINDLNVSVASFGSVYATRKELTDTIADKKRGS